MPKTIRVLENLAWNLIIENDPIEYAKKTLEFFNGDNLKAANAVKGVDMDKYFIKAVVKELGDPTA